MNAMGIRRDVGVLGRRVAGQPFGRRPVLAPGDYGRDSETGLWWVRPPFGVAMALEDHVVIEHDNGTITVEPVITIEPVGAGNAPWCAAYKGHLVCGTWKMVGVL